MQYEPMVAFTGGRLDNKVVWVCKNLTISRWWLTSRLSRSRKQRYRVFNEALTEMIWHGKIKHAAAATWVKPRLINYENLVENNCGAFILVKLEITHKLSARWGGTDWGRHCYNSVVQPSPLRPVKQATHLLTHINLASFVNRRLSHSAISYDIPYNLSERTKNKIQKFDWKCTLLRRILIST